LKKNFKKNFEVTNKTYIFAASKQQMILLLIKITLKQNFLLLILKNKKSYEKSI